MLKEGRDGRDASIKRIVSAQRPVSGLPGRECAPLNLPFLFLRNCKQPSYYTKFPASLQGAPAGPFARGRTSGAPLCTPRSGGYAPTAPLMQALRESMALPCSAPRPTFSRRESRQRYARNLLVPGPPAQGGGPPWIPPASALAVLVEGVQGLRHPRGEARQMGLPIPFPLFRKKTAGCPVGSAGRTWQIEAD